MPGIGLQNWRCYRDSYKWGGIKLENKSQTSEKLAVKVGKEFILEDENTFHGINFIETGTKVEINGEEFPLYKGETFEESRKIDDLLDSGNHEEIINEIKEGSYLRFFEWNIYNGVLTFDMVVGLVTILSNKIKEYIL